MQKTKSIKNFLIFTLLIFLLGIISLNETYPKKVTEGLTLYFYCIVPCLFPYLIIISIIIGLNLTDKVAKIFNPFTSFFFNVNGNVGVALLISLLSGFPVGSKTVADLYKKGLISETEAKRASAFCFSPSPSFLVASVGSIIFKNKRVGIILFLSSLLSCFLIGFIFSFYKRSEKSTPVKIFPLAKNSFSFKNAVYDSVISVLCVGGMITVFYLLSAVIKSLKILYPLYLLLNLILKDSDLSNGLLYGIIEITGGISVLSNANGLTVSAVMSAFLCGFGGISIITQVYSYLSEAKIKTAVFLTSRIVSAVLNALICFILCLIFL